MRNNVWYDYFLKSLSVKYPKKGQLVDELMDLLCIEREAVYRRLRKDVVFHAFEVAKIASAWNISLDEIIDIDSEKVIFQLQLINYLDPSEKDEQLLKGVVENILHIKDFPDVEFMDVCNKLPRPLLAGYGFLNRYYLFRWLYQYGDKEGAVSFSDIVVSEKMRRLTMGYHEAVKQVATTNFILDYRLFENLVRDIQYFHSIRLIAGEEKELIKKDLCDLLDYLSEVTSKGCYLETKNKVNLYISQLSVDTNYSYIYTNEGGICFIHAFDKYEIYTSNSEMIAKFKAWMKLKRRTSTQISGVDERSRIEFFEKQRLIAEKL